MITIELADENTELDHVRDLVVSRHSEHHRDCMREVFKTIDDEGISKDEKVATLEALFDELGEPSEPAEVLTAFERMQKSDAEFYNALLTVQAYLHGDESTSSQDATRAQGKLISDPDVQAHVVIPREGQDLALFL